MPTTLRHIPMPGCSEQHMSSNVFSWPHGKRAAVSLSFDDAQPSQLDVGMPILDGADVKATFYVSIANLQSRLSDWRSVASKGHEIGNHSLRHPCSGNFSFARRNALEEYSLEQMEEDLLSANQAIHELLGITPLTFAYPCGQTFVGRGEGQRSYVPLVARHFLVGRRAFDEVANDPAFCDLAMATSPDLDQKGWDEARRMIDAAANEGRWLIFMGHDIGHGGRQRVLTGTLEMICRYCRDPGAGIWIDTVAAVGEYVVEERRRNKNAL